MTGMIAGSDLEILIGENRVRLGAARNRVEPPGEHGNAAWRGFSLNQ